jgi:DNA-3-methyladenine glycosylase
VIVARDRLRGPALRRAPLLLGAVLVSHIGGEEVAVRLTEVEAYEGAADPASHAFRGPTRRTEVMFGPPGHLYCYFTYGMHWCANIVCGDVGIAAAVLLRAGEIVRGTDVAWGRRHTARSAPDLARGPARLATCLALDAGANGADVCSPDSPVRLESMRSRRAAGVRAGPRVGIAAAADRPWRFWLDGEPSVSRFRAGARNRRPPDPAD